MTATSRSAAVWLQALGRVVQAIPHTRDLGLEVVEVVPPRVRMRLPWQATLLGDPSRGLIHGGALTMTLDTLCGASVLCGLPAPEVCPTLDLRIDHYRPALAERDLFGEAWVVRITESMVFTQGMLWQDEERPVAWGVANFVRLGPRNTPTGFAEALFGDTGGSLR